MIKPLENEYPTHYKRKTDLIGSWSWLILDGISEIGAHERSNFRLFDMFKAFG